MLKKTLDFSCIPLLETHLPKHPSSDVLQVRNYLGCGMQQAKLYLWFAGGDPTEAIRWVTKAHPRASSPQNYHLLIKAEKGILTDQDAPVETFTEADAPVWLTSENTVPGSTMDNRWFWKGHVLTLEVGASVDTDFRRITRVA